AGGVGGNHMLRLRGFSACFGAVMFAVLASNGVLKASPLAYDFTGVFTVPEPPYAEQFIVGRFIADIPSPESLLPGFGVQFPVSSFQISTGSGFEIAEVGTGLIENFLGPVFLIISAAFGGGPNLPADLTLLIGLPGQELEVGYRLFGPGLPNVRVEVFGELQT